MLGKTLTALWLLAGLPGISLAATGGQYDSENMPLCHIYVAAAEFQLYPRLLHSLYLTEGGKKGWANRNSSNGSLDHGPFQINSIHLARLGQYGIDGKMLASDSMINARVAAWRLKSEIILAGGNVWKGVGNYRSKTPKYHNEQIMRVANKYNSLPDIDYRGFCYGSAR
ncbi:lytic transglycosylase domain-containing protein [Methylobacillus sp. Pita2]|uniref:lytic transglycosylase domain-containing protein n=1 Tax=Methylobacillus sp. Pita2 TaxID=3383245 RepID=UPI0038B4A1CE